VTLARACAMAVAVAVPIVASAQQPFRSGVAIVQVDALVTDGRKPVTGLSAPDFELRDNGVVQTIDSASLESMPISIIFALDTSGSVAGDKMRHLGNAVDLILEGLHGDDRAALVTFSHRVWLRTPLMSDFSALRGLMSSVEAAGGTALFDAVYASLAISEVQDSRPLLVVFSDGLDNMSWMRADVVERAARRANAVVYGVAVAAGIEYRREVTSSGSSIRPVPHYVKGQTDFLEAVADATGGRLLKADSTDKLPKAFDEILREFRTRYVLAYSPRGVDTPGWHRIEVKVKGRSAEIRARTGYQR
jgi:Ca-activated chloride channel family protein